MSTEHDDDRKSYCAAVEDMAQEALDAEKRGEDANDFVNESVDGSYYVIYTHANLTCLQESTNEDAAFDEMGDDALSGCKSYGEVTARLAFFAMRADVQAELDEMRSAAPEDAEDATP